MDCDDIAVLDDAESAGQPRPAAGGPRAPASTIPPSPLMKTRSLSDGGSSTPGRSKLSPSPLLLVSSGRLTCKDDSAIGSSSVDAAPVTPRRPPSSFHHRSQPLQLPGELMQLPQQQQQQQQQHQQQKPAQEQGLEQRYQAPSTPVSAHNAHIQQQLQQQQESLYLNQPMYMSKPIPLSPKLDPSQTYASPTNILPRRSRGLDFSRAATSLHHSTLAEQSSPDSSPTISGGRGAMNIPSRRSGDYGGATESSTSLWSMMGRSHDKLYPSSSLGSVNNACSDSSSSSDDDFMDEDTEELFVTTPQVGKVSTPTMINGTQMAMPWMPTSPAVNSLLSFQHRQRPRKQPKRRVRGPPGLGFGSVSASPAAAAAGSGGGSNLSRSPPGYSILGRESNPAAQQPHSRRESISWAANQLHISGSESDDNLKTQMEAGDASATTPVRDGQRSVIRRVVTRRGNLLPKTKGFARIRAALAEESAPAEAEFRREAEVVRQVLESDIEPADHRLPPVTTANSSPGMFDNLDDLADDVMAMESPNLLGLSGNFRPLAERKSSRGGRPLWEKLEQAARNVAASRTTPPPHPRDSSSGLLDDMSMDSPLAGAGSLLLGVGQDQQQQQSAGNLVFPSGAMFPMTTTSSSGGDTPQPGLAASSGGAQQGQQLQQPPVLPSAAEITRRINSKRRRDDDDLDPVNFKRRAVSPGMSVHNSPVMQSPLQRDVLPWGGPAAAAAAAAAAASSTISRPSTSSGGGSGNGSGFENGGSSNGSGGAANNSNRMGSSNKGRVGYQTMADANDSITRLSIE